MSDTLSSFASAFQQIAGKPCTRPVNRLPDEEFSRLALRLFRLQHAVNADYRRLCDQRGVVVEAVDDWRDIPAVPTAAFKVSCFSCLPAERRTVVFESSATTAVVRSRHHHSAESLAVYEASLLPWFQRHLLPELSPGGSRGMGEASLSAHGKPWFLSLTPGPGTVLHSSLVHMLGCVSRQAWFESACFAGEVEPDGSWRVEPDGALDFLREAGRRETPVVLAGTAFNFVHWLDALEAGPGRLVLPRGSRVMETGGYKGRARTLAKGDLHTWLSRMLSVPRDRIVTEYGMTELSSQAYDRVAGDALAGDCLHFPRWVHAMVISAETGTEAAPGEMGLLRILDLANVFSVMAVETEDLALRDGKGLRLIGRSPAAEPRGCSLQSILREGAASRALSP